MGGCLPSLWHRFQRYTLSGERSDFVRWVPPGSRLLFTQRVHLMGSSVRVQSLVESNLRYAARRVTRKVSGPKKEKALGRKAKLKSSDAIAVDT